MQPHGRGDSTSARAAARPRPGVEPRGARRARRPPSRSGPNATRSSARTGCPTASHMRRTWRLRPSWIVELELVRREPAHRARARSGRPRARRPRAARAARGSRTGAARDRRAVGLRHLVARVGEAVGELAVVGQQDQAGGVGVEAADRVQAPLARRRARRRSGGRAGRCAVETTPARLVERVDDARLAAADRLAVDRDALAVVDVARRVA